ncbi:MAG: winged helix-turn-helix domain-containing protein [Cellvibrio sp.]|uniref:winged helix-turn-helix domain-containing protein n=1 Tax=Cellvibrio sp. TaxID=1965322 RepID=UPI0031A104DC
MNNNNFLNHTYLRCADLQFDLDLGAVNNAQGETQRLSPINLKVLAYLLSRPNEVISRTELFDTVWPNQIVSDDVLTRAISDIRTQLAKLDDSTKFIETLPKRGYRWAIEVVPISGRAEAALSSPNVSQSLSVTAQPARLVVRRFTNAMLYGGAALLLAVAIMWLAGQSMETQINLAVLPAVYERPQTEAAAKMLDEALLVVLRKKSHIKLLSQSAIISRPQNPFPYFFNQFDARWVLESRVSDFDGFNNVELSLVDARTGLELHNINFTAANNTELMAKLARQLETDLLVDTVSY